MVDMKKNRDVLMKRYQKYLKELMSKREPSKIDLTKIDYIKSQDSFLEEFNFNSFNTCRYLLRKLKYELD